MKVNKTYIIFGVLVFLLTGCSQIELYRTKSQVKVDALRTQESVCSFTSDRGSQEESERCSLQHHFYDAGQTVVNGGPLGEQDFYLGFVEFDDQGWMAQRSQMDSLMDFLYEKGKDEDLLMVVFAHGWQHNAGPCDTNVICFRRVLERLDVMEKSLGGGRTVVGVYIGWRGLSATMFPFNYLSFWERKNTADKIGHGGVTELLVKLDDFQKANNRSNKNSMTHLLIAGHSFGGQVMYSALSQILIDRAGEINHEGETGSSRQYKPAESFGSLVVLVNPAFEGAKYEPLFDLARNRKYSVDQKPIMMVVTSQTDLATKLAFPLGRYLSTFWEGSQSDDKKETLLHTVGHLDRYQTHSLSLNEDLVGKNAWRDEGTKKKGDCPHLSSTKDFVTHFFGENESTNRATIFVDLLSPGDRSFYGDEYHLIENSFSLTKEKVGYPYWVVSTHKNIIPDHNQIYQPAFINFLQRFYFKNIYNHE